MRNNPFNVNLNRFRNIDLDDLDWDEIEEFDLARGDREYTRHAERELEEREQYGKEKDNAQ